MPQLRPINQTSMLNEFKTCITMPYRGCEMVRQDVQSSRQQSYQICLLSSPSDATLPCFTSTSSGHGAHGTSALPASWQVQWRRLLLDGRCMRKNAKRTTLVADDQGWHAATVSVD